jgi:uncharacterized membrane protein YkoI
VKLKIKLLICTFIVCGLLGTSACSMTENKSETVQTINESKAIEIASNSLKGGVVTSSHIDETDGANKYEVVIYKGDKNYEVDVDSLTGKILEVTERDLSMSEEGSLQNVSPKISSREARQIALDQVRGTITELDLDTFNNRLVYDIEISTVNKREVDVIVDAMDGKVLKVEELSVK